MMQQPAPVLITTPNDNDVLLGRGTGPNRHPGNQHFRSLVAARRGAYNSTRSHHPKHLLARQVYDVVRASGGRFIRKSTFWNNGLVWEEVSEATALVKCKQSLREVLDAETTEDSSGNSAQQAEGPPSNYEPARKQEQGTDDPSVGDGANGNDEPNQANQEESVDENPGDNSNAKLPCHSEREENDDCSKASSIGFGDDLEAICTLLIDSSEILDRGITSDSTCSPGLEPTIPKPNRASLQVPALAPPSHLTSILPSMLVSEMRGSRDEYFLSSNRYQMVRLGEMTYHPLQHAMATNTMAYSAFATRGVIVGTEGLAQATFFSQSSNQETLPRPSAPAMSGQSTEAMPTSEDNVEDLIISAYNISDRPRFTEEHEHMEYAAMTETERVDALIDMFGKLFKHDEMPSKKAKRDLDGESILFLVKQMRLAIERIPADQKLELLDAQWKCDADEFCDSRLERFLRCEGMNTKLAATRFVSYWKCRREVFGDEKYLLPMTLSGALCDDITALETGFCCLLPRLDQSGRQLVFWEPRRHTKEGYTSESMLRAIWYVMEVASQTNAHVSSGIVFLEFATDVAVLNFDAKITDCNLYFDKHAWPVQFTARHVCCAPKILLRILKPICLAMLDKRARSRIMFHEDPESQIVDTLSTYGIKSDMIPTQMGGTLQFSMKEWVANRRAVELAEI